MDDISRILLQASRLSRGGKHEKAEAILRERLHGESNTDIRSEIVSFLADLIIDRDPHTAARLYEEALRLSGDAFYRRYTLELALADVSERLGHTERAVDYYKNAMTTVLDAGDISAGSALAGMLKLRGDHLSDAERELCIRALLASWAALRMAGPPPLDNLPKAADDLMQAAGGA